MSRYVFDSDAWHCCRNLRAEDQTSVLDAILSHGLCTPVVVTDFIRRVELQDLSRELDALLRAGTVKCVDVAAADANYKRLRKSGIHKGEASAIAWLLAQDEYSRPVLVTRDRGAALAASAERVDCTDVLGLVVDLVTIRALREEVASFTLSIWDDKSKQLCRPRDWRGYVESFARRKALGPPYFRAD